MKFSVFFKALLLSLFLVTACNILPAAAQTQSENSTPVSSAAEAIDLSIVRQEISKIQQKLAEDAITKEKIDSYVSYLTQQENIITENRKGLEKQVKFIQKQLAALGDGPKENETEDEAITAQRDELSLQLAAQDRLLKEADLVVIQIEDLTAQILNVRNQKIYGDMMTRQSAFINPMVFFYGIKAYIIFFWDVTKSPIDWYSNLPQQQRSYALLSIISMFFILMIALGLAILLKRFILRNWGYKADIKNPTFNRKVVAAVAVAVARGLIFSFLVGGCILWMVSTKIFGKTLLDTVLMTMAYVCLIAIVETTASFVTFAPNYPQWRLINISSEKATRFTRMIFLFIIINAIANLQVLIAMQAEYSVETLHFLMIIACAVKAFFLMWFAKISFDAYKDEIKDNQEEILEEDTTLSHGFKLTLACHLFCSLTFVLSLLGYPELSLFILNNVILSLIICGLFEVVRRSIIDISEKIILSGPWMKGFRRGTKFASKVDFWTKIVINPTLALVLVFSLLNLWGLPGDFMLQAAKKLLFGFKIGGIQISLIAIVLGIAVFFGSLTLVRIVKNKLANNVLNKIDMDDGIKHSLVSGVGFVGFIVSALLGVIAVGIDLTNLAFIAGALSVGIGFGLQDVIKNLVAGIIILLERPFKVGDWVVLGGVEGTIRQINIRSTELMSFDKMSVIIPNATLISSTVTNKTHGDSTSRQSVVVGVAYGSDVQKVTQILLECAAQNKAVMKNPAPYVLFKDFGSSSLDFELRCYVNDIRKGWTTPSELRYAIYKRFNEEGIEIPFPQVVVNHPAGEQMVQQAE